MGNGTQKKRYFFWGGVISNGPMKETSFFTRIILHLRKPTTKALNTGRIPKGKDHLPTAIFQGQAVSFRAGNHYDFWHRPSINLILVDVLNANCVKTKAKLSPRQRPTQQVEVEMSESTGLQPQKKTAKRKTFRTISGWSLTSRCPQEFAHDVQKSDLKSLHAKVQCRVFFEITLITQEDVKAILEFLTVLEVVMDRLIEALKCADNR